MHRFINVHAYKLVMEERHRRLLIKQNPWWQDKKIEVPKFERDLLNKLTRYVKYKQIIAVVGLRRVGKTTLMKQLLQKLKVQLKVPKNNICYISFDDIDFQKYEIAEDLINYFLEFSDKRQRRYLFLDEIQKLPNWADLLKVFYDTEENLKIIVSGSASLEIQTYKETLAGRILTFNLPILTFKEFVRYFIGEHEISPKSTDDLFRIYDLKFAMKKREYERLLKSYLTKGAFPELLDIEEEEFIKKYIKESVIEKAISDIAKITEENEKTIYELFRLLASSNAQLFEIVNLADILKINRNLVSYYVSLLEKAFLIKVSYNFTKSIAKQVRVNKKQYSAHSSVVIASLDYSFDVIETEVAGHLVEATIANSMDKISFWRTPQKDEVDIILKVKEALPALPIEVKYQSQISGNDLKPLLKFCRKFHVKKGIIVTKDLFEKRSIEGIEILLIPVWLFLLISIVE